MAKRRLHSVEFKAKAAVAGAAERSDLWVANSYSCRKDVRTISLAVFRAGTAGPESVLRIFRWVTEGRSPRRRSIGRHTSRPSKLPGHPRRALHPHAAIGV
jgi:hypothetical protein